MISQMTASKRFIIALLVLAVFMTGPFLLSALIIWINADAATRAQLSATLVPYWPLGTLTTITGFLLGVVLLRLLFKQYVNGLLRMAEEQQLMLQANQSFLLKEQGPPEIRALAQATNQLARQRNAVLNGIQQQIAAASQQIQHERNHFANLVADLKLSLVACRADGTIFLYNRPATQLFRRLSPLPDAANGSELIGLGKSIYRIIDEQRIVHALTLLQRQQLRGAALTSTQFVTTCGDAQLLHIEVVAMQPPNSPQTNAPPESSALSHGFMLLLDNMTQKIQQENKHNQVFLALLDRQRTALAQLRSHLSASAPSQPDSPPLKHIEQMQIILNQADTQFGAILQARWPMEDIFGIDFIHALQQCIEQQLPVSTKTETLDATVWLYIDSYALLQGLLYLTDRLHDAFALREIRLGLTQDERGAHIELIWYGQALSTETAMNWELESLNLAGERNPSTLRDILSRHHGALELDRHKVQHRACFRIVLPPVAHNNNSTSDAASAIADTTIFNAYDFELLYQNPLPEEQALADAPLETLSYTVFDTETTGLNPSLGDEIIQLGATRIVNGRRLPGEYFEQLINPPCALADSAKHIHGITEAQLAHQPTIDAVLPIFYSYAERTVLIAHNAAFDLRFLQRKEHLSRLKFDHPILDTLLLSTILHPNQSSHTLEAIAERMNINVKARHSALADAIMTADIFLCMLPLLKERGITTLQQALDASQYSPYAKLEY